MMLVVVLVLILCILVFVGMYNALVRKRNNVRNALSGIDVQLKKRFDLIPNLVETVKEYCRHEESVLTKITELRSRNFDDLSVAEKTEMENAIRSAARSLQVSVEQYPELKASQNFEQLQRALNETEEQLSAARRSYNAAVTDLNTSVECFPTNLLAKSFGFGKEKWLEIEEGERKNIDVKSIFKNK